MHCIIYKYLLNLSLLELGAWHQDHTPPLTDLTFQQGCSMAKGFKVPADVRSV